MDFLFLGINFYVFIIGLCVGSFLNCVIYRLKEKKSFLEGRSFCPSCKHTLAWKDLFPLISFIILKGRCRYCKKRISLQYPIVEVITAFLFLLIFVFYYPHFLKIIFLSYIACVFIIIFVYDLKYFIIPDKIVLPAIVVSFFYNFFQVFLKEEKFLFQILSPNFSEFKNIFFSAFLASLFFFILFFVSKGEWMGFGDVKLVFLIGLLLKPPLFLLALFLSFLLGSLIGGFMILVKRKGLKTKIPFAPFLISGAFISLFLGETLIDWYLSLL